MPPSILSRFRFCEAVNDAEGNSYLTEREPFGFQDFADNALHTVRQGETLYSLASRYFAPIDNAAQLWWIIADFQPSPIFDPTIPLAPGAVLYVPSMTVVQTRMFNEARRYDATA